MRGFPSRGRGGRGRLPLEGWHGESAKDGCVPGAQPPDRCCPGWTSLRCTACSGVVLNGWCPWLVALRFATDTTRTHLGLLIEGSSDARLETRIKESAAHTSGVSSPNGQPIEASPSLLGAGRRVVNAREVLSHTAAAVWHALCFSCDDWVMAKGFWSVRSATASGLSSEWTEFRVRVCVRQDPKGSELCTTMLKPWETAVDGSPYADVQIVCQSGVWGRKTHRTA